MQENLDAEAPKSRLLKSARVLKVFFERKLNLQLELLTEAPAEPLNEGLQFDLRINELGLWGVRASAPLNEKQQTEIASSFHGLLGALGDLDQRRRELMFIEDRMIKTLEDLPSNVIPLRRPQLNKARPFAAVSDKRWILRLDCLIESPNISEIHKMAFELHSQSQRYAFVEYRDLDKSCRMNVSELMELGAVSLFVPSILDLNAEEQRVLRQVMQNESLHRPLLMVGATMPYAELRSDASIDLEFLVLLSRAYIKLTRPFIEYKDQGLIHYFLDSLSQNPT